MSWTVSKSFIRESMVLKSCEILHRLERETKHTLSERRNLFLIDAF